MKILFASKNKNKFEEIKEIFSDSDFEIIFDDSLEVLSKIGIRSLVMLRKNQKRFLKNIMSLLSQMTQDYL